MHRLDGPRIKVKWAKSQIVTLNDSVQGLFERYPYDIFKAELNRKTGYYDVRARGGPSTLPDEWGVIIGEIAHDLRSALDGLTWQLALSGPDDPFFRTSFPICLDRDDSKKIGDRPYPSFKACQSKKGGCLQSVPSNFWARIESFQPYEGGNGDLHSPLVLLNELNNTDKHRLITVLVVTPVGWHIMGPTGTGSRIKAGVPLHTNAKIGQLHQLPPNGIRVVDLDNPFTDDGRIRTRVEHEVQADIGITPGIRFGGGCDAVKRLPVIPTLARMADQVNTIVESFASQFRK